MPGCVGCVVSARDCCNDGIVIGRTVSTSAAAGSATTARSRATPKTATPSNTSSANRKNAFVRQGPAAAATVASGWVSSTAAGGPTPERNRSGSITDIVPSKSVVCGMPRSASLIVSFSPGRLLPIRLVWVE